MKDNPPRISADKYLGVFTNVAPDHIPVGGAQEQWNMRCQRVGQLDVRDGLRACTSAASTTASTYDVISMYQYPVPGGNTIVYELSDGTVKVLRSPQV